MTLQNKRKAANLAARGLSRSSGGAELRGTSAVRKRARPPSFTRSLGGYHGARRSRHRSVAGGVVTGRAAEQLRVSRGAVLADVEPFELVLALDAQGAGRLDRVHERHAGHDRRNRNG